MSSTKRTAVQASIADETTAEKKTPKSAPAIPKLKPFAPRRSSTRPFTSKSTTIRTEDSLFAKKINFSSPEASSPLATSMISNEQPFTILSSTSAFTTVATPQAAPSTIPSNGTIAFTPINTKAIHESSVCPLHQSITETQNFIALRICNNTVCRFCAEASLKPTSLRCNNELTYSIKCTTCHRNATLENDEKIFYN